MYSEKNWKKGKQKSKPIQCAGAKLVRFLDKNIELKSLLNYYFKRIRLKYMLAAYECPNYAHAEFNWKL